MSSARGKRSGSPLWDDLRFPVSGLNPGGSLSPPALDTTNSGTMLFAHNADNIIGGIAQMPHTWLEGSAIRPHIHWGPVSAAAGNVYWRLEYKIVPVNSAIPGSWTTLNQIPAAGGVADAHKITTFGNVTMTGHLISVVIFFRMTRPGNSEADDTYGENARLIKFGILYQSDSGGSVGIFQKWGPTSDEKARQF